VPVGVVYQVSRGELDTALVIVLLVTVLAAVAVYRSSERFRWTHGTTPWRIPSWLWVVLVIIFFPWTLILYLLARLTTRPRQPQGPPYGPGGPYPPYGYGPPPGSWPPGAEQGGAWPGPGGWSGPPPGVPGAPGGWGSGPTGEPWRPPRPAGPPSEGPGTPPPQATPDLPPSEAESGAAHAPGVRAGGANGALPPPPNLAPGWYVDPTDRFFLRYWDGSRWTERVASGGRESVDPLEPR